MFRCLECGKKFRTVKAAERASHNGCPGCGGVDIDLDTSGGVPVVFPRPAQEEDLRAQYNRVVKILHLRGRA